MREENVVIYTAETREGFCDLVNRYYIKYAYSQNGKKVIDGKVLYTLKTKGTQFTVLSSFGIKITCILVKENLL